MTAGSAPILTTELRSKEHRMAPAFNGRISLDIRDSEPDWAPYLAPKAPEGAPNVLIIAWDDLGYATMDTFGGPVECPNMARIADERRQVRELPHDRALLADAGLAAHGPQRHVERHGHDRRVRLRLPRHLDAHPFRERLHLRGARRARLQHLLRRQVAPHAGRGVQPRRLQGPLAARAGASSASMAGSAARRTRTSPTSSTTTTRSRRPAGPRTATTSPTTWRARPSSSSGTRR